MEVAGILALCGDDVMSTQRPHHNHAIVLTRPTQCTSMAQNQHGVSPAAQARYNPRVGHVEEVLQGGGTSISRPGGK
jgi:hypothetical protein